MIPSGNYSTTDNIEVHCVGWIRSLEKFFWIKGSIQVELQKRVPDQTNPNLEHWIKVALPANLSRLDLCDCRDSGLLDVGERKTFSYHALIGRLAEGDYRVRAELLATYMGIEGSRVSWRLVKQGKDDDGNLMEVVDYSYFEVERPKGKRQDDPSVSGHPTF